MNVLLLIAVAAVSAQAQVPVKKISCSRDDSTLGGTAAKVELIARNGGKYELLLNSKTLATGLECARTLSSPLLVTCQNIQNGQLQSSFATQMLQSTSLLGTNDEVVTKSLQAFLYSPQLANRYLQLEFSLQPDHPNSRCMAE